MNISSEQKRILLSYLEDYKNDPTVVNEGVKRDFKAFDESRVSALPKLKSTISDFINKKMPLQDFKEKSEVQCREFPFWGFKGFSGQMQLNQYSNNINSPDKEPLLREAILVPKNKGEAKEKINKIASFLTTVRENAQNTRSIPWVSQIYMLSYFWEIQNHIIWPVHYISTKNTLLELGFTLDILDSYGDEYLRFLEIMNMIWELYGKEGCKKETYPFWFVEHVLWKHFTKTTSEVPEQDTQTRRGQSRVTGAIDLVTSGSWLPNIVVDLNDLAFNRETQWSRNKSVSPQKAFETKLRYAFTILGYETTELGQGTGREPDGIALSMMMVAGEHYAIIYDAKAREKKYAIGTNDREIYEYIVKKQELLRRKRINRLYFAIISSEFDESDQAINLARDIFRRTRVPVTFLRAADLQFIIEAKTQDVEIDHRRIENLFLDTGVITRERITADLGLR